MEKDTMRPFSNSIEAMVWLDHNCENCVKAFVPKDPSKGMPDFNATQRLVNLGRECRLKFAIDVGFVTGEIPMEVASVIGYTEENGFPDQCMMFSDNDDDGFKPTPRKPKDEPPSQLCMPFAVNEILKDHKQLEHAKG